MSFIKTYIFLSFALPPLYGVAQNDHAFEALTTREGLSENVILCIYQDKKGLMWFGTHDGLNMYDGYRFRIYRHDPEDSSSLPGNIVSTIMQDEAGRYWVGTNNGCGLLDPVSGTVFRIPFGKTTFNENVSQIVAIGKHEYLLFGGSNSKGAVFLFDMLTNAITSVYCKLRSGDKAKFGLFGNVIPHEHKLYAKIYRTGTKYHCFVEWNPKTKMFDEISADDTDLRLKILTGARSYLIDQKQRVWASFYAPPMAPETRVYDKNLMPVFNGSLIKNFTVWVNSMAEDAYGDIWMTNNANLFRWDEQLQQLIHVVPDRKNRTSCSQVFVDRSGLVWVGTRGKGVLKYNPVRLQFNSYTATGNKGALFKPFVLGLASYKKNQLWVKHDFADSIITEIDLQNHRMRYVSRDKLRYTIALDKPFFDYLENHDLQNTCNLLWGNFATLDFFSYISKVPHLIENTPRSRRLLNILHGIYHYNSGQSFPLQGISIDSMSVISARLQGDTLWLCNGAHGLVAVQYKHKKWTHYLTSATDKYSLSSNHVKDVLFTPNGNLWVATDNGLNYLDKSTRKFYRYSERNGLCHRAIYCMTYDQKGRIWLGTGNGLSCFDTATKRFFNYTEKDGLINTEYNRHSAYTSPEGWVYMGGTNGIDYFHPEALTYSLAPPSVVFSGFQVFNEAFPIDNLPKLKHYQNYISVSFTTADYTYPSGNKFLYKLDGIDRNWTLLQGDNIVRYANLPPHNYRLLVKAANYRGIWNNQPAILRFTIRAPWWQQWWFYAAVVIVMALIVFLFVKSYTRSKLNKQRLLLEKKQAVETERLRISAELHDDVGGELSAIRLLSEMAQMKNPPDMQQQFSKISASSAELVQKMNEIVWALNINNDTLQSLIAYIHRYAVKYLEEVDIECRFTQPAIIPDCEVDGTKRRNIFLLVKEALNNVVKHANATRVCICITIDSYLHISVHDNGKGISLEKLIAGGGNGRFTMQRRVKDLNGEIQISNHEGTTLNFQIPLTKIDTKV